MKVITLATRFSTGGAQLNTLLVSEELKARGYESKAIYMFRVGDMDVDDVTSYKIISNKKDRLLYLPVVFFSLFRYLYKSKPDVIIGFHPMANIAGALFKLLFPSTKVIGTQRNPQESMSRITGKMDFILGQCVYDKNICVTNSVSKSFSHYPDKYTKKMIVVHNGLDVKPAKSEAMLSGAFSIGFIGRLDKQKDPFLYVESARLFMKMADTPEDVIFYVAGVGELEEEMRMMVAKFSLEANFMFLGNLKGDDVLDFYNKIDVFVLTSKFEGFGRTILESMSFGNAMVLKDLDVCREVAGNTALYATSADEYARNLLECYKLKIDGDLIGFIKPGLIKDRYSRFTVSAMINGYESAIND